MTKCGSIEIGLKSSKRGLDELGGGTISNSWVDASDLWSSGDDAISPLVSDSV